MNALDPTNYPDWEKMSELNIIGYRQFAAERWQETVHVMYNEIVANPDVDNDELTSVFLDWCKTNPMLKLMFNTWIEGFQEHERPDGPITCKEILSFVHYLAMCEERQIQRLREEGLNG